MKEEKSLGRYLMDPYLAGRAEGCWRELADDPYPLVDLAGTEDEERHNGSSVEVVVGVVAEVEPRPPSCL